MSPEDHCPFKKPLDQQCARLCLDPIRDVDRVLVSDRRPTPPCLWWCRPTSSISCVSSTPTLRKDQRYVRAHFHQGYWPEVSLISFISFFSRMTSLKITCKLNWLMFCKVCQHCAEEGWYPPFQEGWWAHWGGHWEAYHHHAGQSVTASYTTHWLLK